MAHKATLSGLRDALAQTNREISQENGHGETTNAEILKRIRAQYSDSISALEDKLVDMALTKLLNDVCGQKRKGVVVSDGPDLFGDYPKLPQLVSIGRGRKKAVGSLTVREAASWIQAHDAKAVSERNKDFKRLLEVCRERMETEDDTIEIALQRNSR